jgi:NAD(P)-dependent dehydrogenase (short-subunit alcohol dehydrogenase family)
MKTDRTVVITGSADVTDEADAMALAELARQTTGRVDVLVNVAGFVPT